MSKARQFSILLPDTSKTWAGRRTKETFFETQKFEKALHLESLQNGQLNTEFRFWALSSSYDPQHLLILRSTIDQTWELRQLAFEYSHPGRIISDTTNIFKLNNTDSSKLNSYWQLNSQSDLKNGDSFGCMDGDILFVELSDWTRYRFLWYKCPFLQKEMDSTFLKVNDLRNYISELSRRK